MIVIGAIFFFSVRTMYLLYTSGGVRKKYFQHYIVISSSCFTLLCTSVSVVVCVFDLLFIFRA